MRFVDLFAGLGGFHIALRRLGHECVFASEIDDELRAIYARNFPHARGVLHGDIRQCKSQVPSHDILCAGFPCQPFSKSGSQRGRHDRTRGTLFDDVLEILEAQDPPTRYVVLENVGNFERHDGGNTWRIVRESLESLGYHVRGTEHITSGGHGLISPHHFGYPQHRERFFAVASLDPLPADPFPRGDRAEVTSLATLVQRRSELTPADIEQARLTAQQVACIRHWNVFLRSIPKSVELPSFPIWGDELWETYPFLDSTPFACSAKELRRHVDLTRAPRGAGKEELLAALPSYARVHQEQFPRWKSTFIAQNRAWLRSVNRHLPRGWIEELRVFPPSLRKLEWNCKGGERNLWRYVLQFRPSGLRTKRYTSCPALVAMTTTQVPILGPERRFITRVEGLRLQGFSADHELPASRADAFQALGNAAHVEVAVRIIKYLLGARVTAQIAIPRARERQLDLPLVAEAIR